MAATAQENVLTHRFALHALYLGVPQLVEVKVSFVSPGRAHAHPDQVQMIFQLEGRMELDVGGERWQMVPGTRCVVPAGEPHQARPVRDQPDVRFLDLRIGQRLKTTFADYALSLPAGVCPGPVEPLMIIVRRLAVLATAGPQPPAAMLAADVWSLLALYERLPEAHTTEPVPADSRLRMVDLLMREHLSRPISVEELAERVKLSPSRLRQLVMEQYGIPPLQRYHQLRLDQARLLVERSTLSIREIAHSCGFRNPNHFSRVFSDWAKSTPTEVRRQAQSQGWQA